MERMLTPIVLLLLFVLAGASWGQAPAQAPVIEPVTAKHALILPDTAGPYPKGKVIPSPAAGVPPMVRVTDIVADVAEYLKRHPGAAPANMEAAVNDRDADGKPNVNGGLSNEYHKFSALDESGHFLMLQRPANLTAIYQVNDDGTSATYYRTLAATQFNGVVTDNMEVRWWPKHPFQAIWHEGPNVFAQDVRVGVASNRQLMSATIKVGEEVIPFEYYGGAGGEGDWSDDGRYFAAKFTSAAKVIYAGVIDVQEARALPGFVRQDVWNNCDVSPDGKWLVVSPHNVDTIPLAPFRTRFYSIADLTAGDTTKPLFVDSFKSPTGTYSIGHWGWAQLADGASSWVMFYQDNKDDFLKAFNPATGKSFSIYYMPDIVAPAPIIDAAANPSNNPPDLRWHTAQHNGRMRGLPGWTLLSMIGDGNAPTDAKHPLQNQLMLLELKPADADPAKGPRLIRRESTNNVYTGQYATECFAAMDFTGTKIIWGSNWNLKSSLDVYMMRLPKLPDATPEG